MKLNDFVRIKSVSEIVAEGNPAPSEYGAFRGIEEYFSGDCYGTITKFRDQRSNPKNLVHVRFGGAEYFFADYHLELVSEAENFYAYSHNLKRNNVVKLKDFDPNNIISKRLYDTVDRNNAPSYVSDLRNPNNIFILQTEVSPENLRTGDSFLSDIISVKIITSNHTVRLPAYIPVGLIEDSHEMTEPIIASSTMGCSRCGCTFITRINIATDLPIDICNEDRDLCPTCRKREFVTPYHRLTPKLNFINTDKDKDSDLYFGFELEVAKGGESNEVAKNVMRLMNNEQNRVYCSHDSSINRGFEIISHPMTIEAHRDNKEKYDKLFKYLSDKGYRSHEDESCGLHVHFSRAYFDKHPGALDRLLFMVNKFWDDMVIFSRKSEHGITNYAKSIDCYSVSSFISRWDKTSNHSGHYYAVNIVNQNTIEFRIWRGTLNTSLFMATMELTYNIVTAAATKTLSELSDMKFEDLLDGSGKRYYELKKAMAKEFGVSEYSAS